MTPFRALSGPPADLVELGTVTGIFGVRGEVRLHLHNRESHLLDGEREVLLSGLDGRWYAGRLQARDGAGKRILGRFRGLTDREVAGSLQGWRIFVTVDSLPDLDEGEFYVRDLEGMEVVADGVVIGRVTMVHAAGDTDVLEVQPSVGEAIFLPCVREVILDVDLIQRRVVVEPGAWEG